MAVYLGITLFAFFFTAIGIVPFIDFLYRIRFTYHKYNLPQALVPVGGGILLITVITVLFFILLPLLQSFGVYVTSVFPFKQELNILFFTLISFGLLGLLSDLVTTFNINPRGLVKRLIISRSLLQMVLSLLVSIMLFLSLNIQTINIPFFGVIQLGVFFIPIAAVIIFLFSHSLRIADGMDGLAAGVLLISLLTFWGISLSVLDTPLSIFIALWIGALLAFLYFNVYPARILLGQTGSIAFGATLAVVGFLLGKITALFLIGGVFLAESLVYLLKYYLKTSSVQGYLLARGWPEPKIVMRLWLVAIVFSLVGLWLALN